MPERKTRDYRKRRTKPQGWKMRDWNTRHHTSAKMENAGLQNAGMTMPTESLTQLDDQTTASGVWTLLCVCAMLIFSKAQYVDGA